MYTETGLISAQAVGKEKAQLESTGQDKAREMYLFEHIVHTRLLNVLYRNRKPESESKKHGRSKLIKITIAFKRLKHKKKIGY